MARLRPEQYYPCLAYPERDAIRLIYDSFVPLYFVVPCKPVDDYYAACPINFDGRQENFELMFKVIREEFEIVPGEPPIECYVGFYTFYLDWLLYDPICCGAPRPDCFIDDYSNV